MKRTTLIAVIAAAIAIIGAATAVFHLTQTAYKAFAPGRLHFEAGRYEDALPLLTRAHKHAPENTDIARYLLWTCDKLGRHDEVRAILEKLAAQAAQDSVTLLWLADLSAGVGDFARAEQLYRSELDRADSTAVRRKLAETLVWQKKYNEARDRLDALKKELPEDRAVVELFADVCVWTGDYQQAIEAYEQLLGRRDADREIYFKLAEALRFAGRNDEAVEMYKRYADQ